MRKSKNYHDLGTSKIMKEIYLDIHKTSPLTDLYMFVDTKMTVKGQIIIFVHSKSK